MIKYISKINWLAVLLSLFFYSFLGWLWFIVLLPTQYNSILGANQKRFLNMAARFTYANSEQKFTTMKIQTPSFI